MSYTFKKSLINLEESVLVSLLYIAICRALYAAYSETHLSFVLVPSVRFFLYLYCLYASEFQYCMPVQFAYADFQPP
jgi:hypothetical protein